MIRRLLLFVALMALGFFVLRLVVGEGAFTARSAGATPGGRSGAQGGGIALQSGTEAGSPVTFSVQGAIEMQRTRELPLPGGGRRVLPTYRVRAEDSRPVPGRDNLLEMFRVTVEMFRIAVRDGEEPRADAAGELAAASVLVEIERDEHGRPSLQEDREMDVRDATFRSLPSSGFAPMTLQVGRARLHIGKTGSALGTAPAERFTLTFGGDRPGTLVGAGLTASIPADAAAGPVEVRVLSEPVLTMDDGRTVLRARGGLRFAEQPDQVGTIDLDDDVSLVSALQGRQPFTASGAHLRAVLRRGRSAGTERKPAATWSSAVLTGAPCRVEGEGFELTGDRLDVLPGLRGGVRLLTASGQPARLILAGEGAERSELAAERRIHILPLAELHHELTGAFGFPRGALGAGADQLVLFEGRTEVGLARPEGPVRLTAGRGLRVLRSATPGGATTLAGTGEVRATVAAGDLEVSGGDGFVLHEAPAAGGREFALALGGAGREPAPFVVRRGDGLRLRGTGRCELRQGAGANASARLELWSEAQDAVAELPQGTLRRLRHLVARTEAGALAHLTAEGEACELEAALADGRRVTGAAETITSSDAGSFRLEGRPAWVRREGEGELFGEAIDVRRSGGAVGLRAAGRARLTGSLRQEDGSEAKIDLAAGAIAADPFRAPAAALRWYDSFLGPVAMGFASPWRVPHVHATGEVRLALPDAQGSSQAGGDELWLALEGDAIRGLLRGKPARATVEQAGQSTTGEAPEIRFARRSAALAVTLVPRQGGTAAVLLADADGARVAGLPAAVAALAVHSAGPVRLEERSVLFTGPVRVLGDDAAGARVLELHAAEMRMARDAAGAVTEITAAGDVRLESSRLRGRGEQLTLHLRRTLCTLSHPRGAARLELADGRTWQRGMRIEVDYTSYAVRAWYGDVGGGASQ